jgi:acetolactate synthase-1/2/3 large subunit
MGEVVTRSVSDQLWLALHAAGADCVFGLPGTQTIDAFQALRRSSLRTVVATHEMAAAFMANGYARASGRPGVLTTIPGPGFTYALTGLAEAWLDSVPIVHVVPAAREIPDREFALQAIDQRAMAGPVLKRIIAVARASEVTAGAVTAYRLATAGEPGPVMLELPEELFSADSPEGADAPPMTSPVPATPAQLDEMAVAIGSASRVLLYLGAGTLDSPAAARAFAEATGAAVLTTTTARGVLSEADDRVVVRDPGMQDNAVINALVERADLVIAAGCKFSHNGAAGFNLRLPQSKLISINAGGPSRNDPARIKATADAGATLRDLTGRIPPRLEQQMGWDAAELSAWRTEALKFERASQVEPRLEGTGKPVSTLIRELRDALPDDAIVVTDSGLHQMSTRRYYEVRSPRGLIVPTNFQSMGYALPTAIGAAIAAPGRRVVAVIGDGGMIMSGLELLTAARENVPLTVVVFNDGAYSLIRNAQLSGHGWSHGTDLMSPDFEALAAATGAAYQLVGADGLAAPLAARDPDGSPVLLVEVPLRESPGLARIRRRGRLRATARRILPRKAHRFLSRWLKR